MAQNYCTQCGSQLVAGQNYCTSCGTPVFGAADAPLQQAAVSSEQPTRSLASDNATQVMGAAAPKQPTYSDTSGVDRLVSPEPVPAQPVAPTTVSPFATAPATGYASAPNAETAQMPPVDYGGQMRYTAAEQAYAGSSSSTGTTQIVLAVIAAVAILGLAIVLVVLHPWDQGSRDNSQARPSSAASSAQAPSSSGSAPSSSSAAPSTSSSHEESSSSTQSSSSQESSSSSVAPEDERLLSQLVDAYDRMGGYDQRIADVANSFNNTWASSDNAARRANADKAKQLQSEISAQLAALQALSVPSGSKYAGDYSNMLQLQEDLYYRIAVIVEAWDNALASSKPKDNQDKILAPLARDNDSSGKNTYKKDFDALYPNARPGQ